MLVLVVLTTVGCVTNRARHDSGIAAEARAIDFLKREVPAWSRDNGCYSCHNNGDAARALYAATRQGYRVPREVLADTTAWVAQPERWAQNKGDPGFSDQRLADVQFAASLASALSSGAVKDARAMRVAARKVAQSQAEEGSWPIDAANAVGSPATYGSTLATYMAWESLKCAPSAETSVAIQKAEERLKAIKADNVPNASVRLLFAARNREAATGEGTGSSLGFLRGSQTSDGGWGPYLDSPPEAFDTALALLALAEFRMEQGVAEMIQRGRKFLFATQNSDGSWPATTRPSGGQSYAQRMSTTGWVTMALLVTR